MKRIVIAAVVASSLAVFAQAPAPAPAKAAPAPAAPPAPALAPAPAAPIAAAMDMTKMGPAARKPTNEGATKKEIEAWFKQDEALAAARNWDAMLARIDFPVLMTTDSLSGVPEVTNATKEQYIAMMKPMWEMPQGKTTHKLNITVLSDSLATLVDDFSMNMGRQTVKGRNASLLVKNGGQWHFKAMTEAGWGGMAGGAPGPIAAPAPAAPPSAPSRPAPAPSPASGSATPAPSRPAPAPAPAR
jgi:hypothetical protein